MASIPTVLVYTTIFPSCRYASLNRPTSSSVRSASSAGAEQRVLPEQHIIQTISSPPQTHIQNRQTFIVHRTFKRRTAGPAVRPTLSPHSTSHHIRGKSPEPYYVPPPGCQQSQPDTSFTISSRTFSVSESLDIVQPASSSTSTFMNPSD